MKIVMSSGHGKYVRGASGYIDEVDEARLVVEETARLLRHMGVDTVTFHDNVSETQSENLTCIVDTHNVKTRDLDVSVHFNAYEATSKAMGCEVLYASSGGLEYATEIVNSICAVSGLINRGPKKRTDLAFLNNTEETAVLIEVCFVDSTADVDIYHNKFNEICGAIAEGISGRVAPVEPGPPVPVPPEPPAAERRTLSKGMTGTDVANLQKVLGLPADGDFGEITETQVEGFQAACDLDADGVVGPQTWSAVDALKRRYRAGNAGLNPGLKRNILAAAHGSSMMKYNWPGRGQAPSGYIPGMCLAFAVALERLEDDSADAQAMAVAEGAEDTDAMAWYAHEFDELEMFNDHPGTETLRHLFVMLTGLGMRESSGRYCEGRDMSATNVEADTAEAALFQTSWNIASAHSTIPPLLDEFWEDPQGFLPDFRPGVSPDASDLDCYGSGDGAMYQWLAKYCPLFAVFVTAIGLRYRRQHWGPINRKEVTIESDMDTLLVQVQRMVERS